MGARLARRVLPLALLALVGVGVAMAMSTSPHGGTVKAAHNTKYGSLLVSSSGMTLYHMTSETRGAIKCTGDCAKFWPPLVAGGKPTAGSGATASKLGTIKRPDGRLQVTYNGLALYRYASDRKPGDVKGQGVEKVWFAVTAAGKLAKAGAAPAPAPTPAPMPTTTDGGGYGYGGGG
jgi:predicted lipoprotein with Yx(FWY)xxD motif